MSTEQLPPLPTRLCRNLDDEMEEQTPMTFTPDEMRAYARAAIAAYSARREGAVEALKLAANRLSHAALDYEHGTQGRDELEEWAAEARAALSTPAADPRQAGVHAELMRFYGISTDAALIEAQAAHIEKLQAKLPRNDMPAFTRVREG